LTIDKFQALGPGLGLGSLRNRPSATIDFVSSKQPPASQKFADKSELYSALNLPAQNAVRQQLQPRTPWWFLALCHLADLMMAAIFVVVCGIAYKMMNPQMTGIPELNLAPLRVLSFLYIAFVLYLAIFKLLGLTMLGGLVRQRFHKESREPRKSEL
jgi:hypothetical protein